MSLQEAETLNLSVINPILQKVSNDRKHATLAAKIRAFAYNVRQGEIFYFVLPTLYRTADPRQRKVILSKVEFDPKTGKTGVVLFMPAIKHWKQKLAQKDFEYLIAVTFAHEFIHFEIRQDFAGDSVGNEAYAWWITIKALIRPLIKTEDLQIPYFTEMSNKLADLGDDWKHVEWLKIFDQQL